MLQQFRDPAFDAAKWFPSCELRYLRLHKCFCCDLFIIEVIIMPVAYDFNKLSDLLDINLINLNKNILNSLATEVSVSLSQFIISYLIIKKLHVLM